MRKVALVFVLAVFVPSLVLAWLAVRSLRDEQLVLERQQTLLAEGVAEGLAKDIASHVDARREEFREQVESIVATSRPREVAKDFHQRLSQAWPLAEIGFTVALDGDVPAVLSPQLFECVDCRVFRLENDRFLTSRESAEVYWNKNAMVSKGEQIQQKVEMPETDAKLGKKGYQPVSKERIVVPQNDIDTANTSKLLPGQAEFRELVGDSTQGTLARFLQDQLKLLFWCRSMADTQIVFGAQVRLKELVDGLKPLIRVEPSLQNDFTVALLDDTARPMALSREGFRANWKRPFVAAEVGEWLPHWEVAVYLVNPAKLTQAAHTLRWTLGLVIALLVGAIGTGSWLIVTDLRRQLALARQKTDFVSNVSHELKTPLTSIRMFSELLAEGRVNEPARQHQFLRIITAETGRLTRLINNVLDFARMERGEKKYKVERFDLRALIEEVCATYRPHLEEHGFAFECKAPEKPLVIEGDRDSLAQVLVNLISNAEKYSGDGREIRVESVESEMMVQIKVQDRGLGVPKGCEERIFEQFFRAHDSLASGIQGSGLGLTLARQIARAHGGDVRYEAREGGGSCFALSLPKAGSV